MYPVLVQYIDQPSKVDTGLTSFPSQPFVSYPIRTSPGEQLAA